MHCKQFWIYVFPKKKQLKLIPKFIYIFPFMIFWQKLLNAAVSLWTNIIPKGMMITNMPVLGNEPGLPTMSL
jgi:hypothetical protein